MESALTPESFRMVMDELPGRLAAFEAGDESGRVWTTEVDHPRKDGSIATTEIVATFVADERGRPAEVVGVARDISRAEARGAGTEREPRASAIRYRRHPGRHLRERPSGPLHHVQPRGGPTHRQEPRRGPGQRRHVPFPRNRGGGDDGARSQGNRGREHRHLRKTADDCRRRNQHFPFHEGCSAECRGAAVGLFGVARDITERKKAEEQRAKLHMQLLQAQKMESVGTGSAYFPYGEEQGSPPTPTGIERFATYYRDFVGQDYADHRYYNSIGGQILHAGPVVDERGGQEGPG